MPQSFNELELRDQVGNDMAFLAETVNMLRSDAPGLVQQIRASLASGDAPGVGRWAHTLKGMVSNFCAPQAHAAALTVEQLGKGNNLADVPAALDAMERELGVLMAELETFIGGPA